MIARIIEYCCRNRMLVLLLTLFIVLAGVSLVGIAFVPGSRVGESGE